MRAAVHPPVAPRLARVPCPICNRSAEAALRPARDARLERARPSAPLAADVSTHHGPDRRGALRGRPAPPCDWQSRCATATVSGSRRVTRRQPSAAAPAAGRPAGRRGTSWAPSTARGELTGSRARGRALRHAQVPIRPRRRFPRSARPGRTDSAMSYDGSELGDDSRRATADGTLLGYDGDPVRSCAHRHRADTPTAR